MAAGRRLIAAEVENHLRETAAAAMAIGMTELEARQAAISSYPGDTVTVRAGSACNLFGESGI